MVEYEVHGHVGVLTLNRPEARNAVNDVVAQAMTSALEQMEAEAQVSSHILAPETRHRRARTPALLPCRTF